MDLYNLFGTVNTIFIMVSLLGIYFQLKKIWQRKKSAQPVSATALLSLNQFTVSYYAYLAFFIYGYSIEPFNHYIVWPRLIATLLVGLILFEIWQDRKQQSAYWVFVSCLVCLVAACLGLFLGETITDQGKVISTVIMLVVTLLIAQGYFHQIRVIIKSGQTGAVDLKMSQFILMMDVSTIAFALTIGIHDGWPLLVLATTSAITKLVIMYLFKWVNTSATALKRRQLASVD